MDEKPKTVRVRAGAGLSIPLPGNLAIDTGVTVLTPETSVDVIHNLYTRRRLASGDFVLDEGAKGDEVITAEITPDPAPSADDPDARGRRPGVPWSDIKRPR